MPVTTSAKKKLKQDRKRRVYNLRTLKQIKEKVKKYKSSPSKKMLSEVYSMLDIAAKKNIYHSNKSSRLKSRLSLLVKAKTTPSKKTKT